MHVFRRASCLEQWQRQSCHCASSCRPNLYRLCVSYSSTLLVVAIIRVLAHPRLQRAPDWRSAKFTVLRGEGQLDRMGAGGSVSPARQTAPGWQIEAAIFKLAVPTIDPAPAPDPDPIGPIRGPLEPAASSGSSAARSHLFLSLNLILSALSVPIAPRPFTNPPAGEGSSSSSSSAAAAASWLHRPAKRDPVKRPPSRSGATAVTRRTRSTGNWLAALRGAAGKRTPADPRGGGLLAGKFATCASQMIQMNSPHEGGTQRARE